MAEGTAAGPTAAQRRVIEAADPATGRLKGASAQLAALVRLGLAFRHPRPPHDCYLTPAGRRLRDRAAAEPETRPQPQPQPEDPRAGVFTARLGGESDDPPRTAEVRGAWQGLVELRRMTNPDAALDRPCGWERSHLLQAAAIVLEAAGCRPAGPRAEGYRVEPTPQPEAVAVRAADAGLLRACEEALDSSGWHAGAYTEPRTGVRYLLASPRRR
ncbi:MULTISPECIES: hypothetical protein [Streptomyces]|uniref:hypothetical protein n=1 Tax=Streptomyces TaxID=1883 RepID=UPI00140C0089|nr:MULTISPECIES: hypothetical protein [Streptomyces]MDH6223896.1 hypothetical protein [Streptomyces sp. MJP52]